MNHATLTLKDVRQKMDKAVDFLGEQLHGITHIGASNASLVSSIKINYHNQPMPIKHLASIVQSGLKISITPYEPHLVSEIVKECQKAGFSAYKFSKEIVNVTLPIPSGETKIEMKKRIKNIGEETKISIRNIRKKFKQSSEDDSEEKELQKITDEFISCVEEIVNRKMSYVEK